MWRQLVVAVYMVVYHIGSIHCSAMLGIVYYDDIIVELARTFIMKDMLHKNEDQVSKSRVAWKPFHIPN